MHSIFFLIAIIFVFNIDLGTCVRGGREAREKELKYQVSLQLKNETDNICAGTIVGDFHVLTAAYCVTENRDYEIRRRFKIVAGKLDLKNKGGFVRDVVEITIPKGFFKLGTNIVDDIALLKLNESLRLRINRPLEAVDIEKTQNLYKNSSAVVAGYGLKGIQTRYDKENGEIWSIPIESSQLRIANVKIYSKDKCTKNRDFVKITKDMICARIVGDQTSNAEGLCIGDVGAGLIRGKRITGVLSIYAEECNEFNSHSIYTKVSSYFSKNYYEDRIVSLKPMHVVKVPIDRPAPKKKVKFGKITHARRKMSV